MISVMTAVSPYQDTAKAAMNHELIFLQNFTEEIVLEMQESLNFFCI